MIEYVDLEPAPVGVTDENDPRVRAWCERVAKQINDAQQGTQHCTCEDPNNCECDKVNGAKS